VAGRRDAQEQPAWVCCGQFLRATLNFHDEKEKPFFN
jgi:hypothetical protein